MPEAAFSPSLLTVEGTDTFATSFTISSSTSVATLDRNRFRAFLAFLRSAALPGTPLRVKRIFSIPSILPTSTSFTNVVSTSSSSFGVFGDSASFATMAAISSSSSPLRSSAIDSFDDDVAFPFSFFPREVPFPSPLNVLLVSFCFDLDLEFRSSFAFCSCSRFLSSSRFAACCRSFFFFFLDFLDF